LGRIQVQVLSAKSARKTPLEARIWSIVNPAPLAQRQATIKQNVSFVRSNTSLPIQDRNAKNAQSFLTPQMTESIALAMDLSPKNTKNKIVLTI
jgi:hypothetical protein